MTIQHGSISIWFFIGISLLVNGALILGAGIYQLLNPPAETPVVLFDLHANVWWGAAAACDRRLLYLALPAIA